MMVATFGMARPLIGCPSGQTELASSSACASSVNGGRGARETLDFVVKLHREDQISVVPGESLSQVQRM